MGDHANELLQQLEERGEYLRELIRQTAGQIQLFEQNNKKYLNCSIRSEKRYNSFQYFLRENPKDTNGKYLRKSEQTIAKEILQYEYDCRILKYAEEELKSIQRYLKTRSPILISSVYGNYSEARRALVKPVALTDEEYVNRWNAVDYTGKAFVEGEPFYYTDREERVRSKSEALIANMLEKNKIPYRYEFPRRIRNLGLVYPDFTVLDVKRRREILWEHLGLLGKQEYLERSIVKLNCYEMGGYLQGDNLIITYETSSSPLDTRLVKKKIEEMILR